MSWGLLNQIIYNMSRPHKIFFSQIRWCLIPPTESVKFFCAILYCIENSVWLHVKIKYVNSISLLCPAAPRLCLLCCSFCVWQTAVLHLFYTSFPHVPSQTFTRCLIYTLHYLLACMTIHSWCNTKSHYRSALVSIFSNIIYGSPLVYNIHNQ